MLLDALVDVPLCRVFLLPRFVYAARVADTPHLFGKAPEVASLLLGPPRRRLSGSVEYGA